MHFLSDFGAALQDILEQVSQEAAPKCGKKGAKSKGLEY
jgi:hypothetical protein